MLVAAQIDTTVFSLHFGSGLKRSSARPGVLLGVGLLRCCMCCGALGLVVRRYFRFSSGFPYKLSILFHSSSFGTRLMRCIPLLRVLLVIHLLINEFGSSPANIQRKAVQ